MISLTVDEALAKGYTHCISDGSSQALPIDDLDENDLGSTLLLLDPKPQHFALDNDWLFKRLTDEFENAEAETGIDDMKARLRDCLTDSGIDFDGIMWSINQALSNYTYYNGTNIELIPDQTDTDEDDN